MDKLKFFCSASDRLQLHEFSFTEVLVDLTGLFTGRIQMEQNFPEKTLLAMQNEKDKLIQRCIEILYSKTPRPAISFRFDRRSMFTNATARGRKRPLTFEGGPTMPFRTR